MRLYKNPDGTFVGTKAEAPMKKGAVEVEVPTDKPNLIRWLNENAVFRPAESQEESRAPEPPPQPETRSNALKTDAIVEFLLDTATVAQVESIFAAIGCRFAESRKEKANVERKPSKGSTKRVEADAGTAGHGHGSERQDDTQVGEGRGEHATASQLVAE